MPPSLNKGGYKNYFTITLAYIKRKSTITTRTITTNDNIIVMIETALFLRNFKIAKISVKIDTTNEMYGTLHIKATEIIETIKTASGIKSPRIFLNIPPTKLRFATSLK